MGGPLQNSVMMRVYGLKAGHSRWVVSRSNPSTFVDPEGLESWPRLPMTAPTLRNQARATQSPIDIKGWSTVLVQLAKFLHGTPIETDFGPNSEASKALQKYEKPQIQGAIDYWVKHNRKLRSKNPNCPLEATPKRFFPYDAGKRKNWGLDGGFVKAGHNPFLHFIGGYGVEITPMPYPYKELKVEVINETTLKSLTGDQYIFNDSPFGEHGPLGTQTQTYYWYVDRPSLE